MAEEQSTSYDLTEPLKEEGTGVISRKSLEAFQRLFDEQLFCDAILKTDDGQSIRVHKAIMSAASPYFMTLYTTTLQADNDQSDVTLHGIKFPSLQQLVRYAYTRKFSISAESVFDLLITADYLSFEMVKQLCCDFLCENLTVDNCIGIMGFASVYYCPELEESSKIFLLSNFSSVCEESSEFADLEMPTLSMLLADDRLNVNDETDVQKAICSWIGVDIENRYSYEQSLLEYVRLDHEATPRLPRKALFAIGGWSEGSPTRCIEVYDYKTNKWLEFFDTDPLGPRAYHGTAVIGTKIFLIGGFNGSEYFSSCRCYDLATNIWSEIAPMNTKRCYVSVAVLDGFIYAMGGYDGTQRQRSAERYCPLTNQWSLLPSMNEQRSDADACTLNGKIYIVGGFNGQDCLITAEVWDPVNSEWYSIAPMSTRRSGVSCIGYSGKVLVAGGFNGLNRLKSVEWYNPNDDVWYPLPDMHHNRSNFAIEVMNDTVYVMGGFNGTTTISNVECYVQNIGWKSAPTDVSPMHVIRSALTACVFDELPHVYDIMYRLRLCPSPLGAFTSLAELNEEEFDDEDLF